MIRFESDYAEGAHPKVLERIVSANCGQEASYGMDAHCLRAAELIRAECARDDVGVHFLMGGTQTNLVFIAAALRPHEGVIAPVTGHINVHETGAIEAQGHKVIALPSSDGKLTAEQIAACCRAHKSDQSREHTVRPGMVYITQPTENGTVYTLGELEAVSRACREAGILLYMDGARLGCALVSGAAGMSMADAARLCDGFFIGGTKLGALFGEALVVCRDDIDRDMRYIIKQKGAMLAKGRAIGAQFEALFEDGLYYRIARHCVAMALRVRDACRALGCPMLYDSPTNQQFPVLPAAAVETLQSKYAFYIWQEMGDGRLAVRFCTSWATSPDSVDALIADIGAALAGTGNKQRLETDSCADE